MPLKISINHERTNMSQLNFTNHSIKRMSKRKISWQEIEICLSYGDVIHKTGAKHHVISRKVLSQWGLSEKLNGLCVIVSKDEYIITTFKSKNIISYTKRLSKNDLRKFYA
ncbi:MAG: DUF4258 domain-containing protein [Candidatus Sericytochromatia bacterium]|nr:DUF4258 domain-containing protein [Candidatus Sericytochromatia bacterium]